MALLKRKKKKHKIQAATPGSPPGTLSIDKESPKPRITVSVYDSAEITDMKIDKAAELKALKALSTEGKVIWVDVCGLGDAETLRVVGEVFGIHSLILEDIVDGSHRPKVEGSPEMFYVVARRLARNDVLESHQFNLIFGHNFVITLQDVESDNLKPVRDRLHTQGSKIRNHAADYLAYAILDMIVDNYFPLLERYDELLESFENDVTDNPSPSVSKDIHKLKHELVHFRREVAPLRDCLPYLFRDPHNLISAETDNFLRDSRDHIIQVVENLESYREMCTGLAEYHLSVMSNRMNEVMKVLTVISTIFIPLTFLSGLYGMNFNTDKSPFNMPELNWAWGYPFVLSVMFLVGIGMLVFFVRKGWIGWGSRD